MTTVRWSQEVSWYVKKGVAPTRLRVTAGESDWVDDWNARWRGQYKRRPFGWL